MDIVSEHSCLLGEGQVWDTEKKLIYWIDILNGEIHEYDPVQKIKRTRHVHRVIGSFAICTDGSFIAALQNGFALIDRESGEIKMIGDPENTLPNNRFNDGKCDPAGRFWAGTMAFSEATGAGNLYVLENNFTYSRKISNVSIFKWAGLEPGSPYFILCRYANNGSSDLRL